MLSSSDEREFEDEFAHMAPRRRRQCSAHTQVLVPDCIAGQPEISGSQSNLSSPSITGHSAGHRGIQRAEANLGRFIHLDLDYLQPSSRSCREIERQVPPSESNLYRQ